MPRLVRKQVISAVIQPVPGTMTVPSLINDTVVCMDLAFSHVDETIVTRELIRYKSATLARQSCNVGKRGQLTFKTEVKGSGTIDVPPEVGVLLQICGQREDIGVGVNVRYFVETLSTSQQLGSIIFVYDGESIHMLDCVGTFVTTFDANSVAYDEWTITGRFFDDLPQAELGVVNVDSTKPVPLTGMAISFDSISIPGVNTIVADIGNEISNEMGLTASDGYETPTIVNNNPTGSFSCLMTNPVSHDWQSYWRSNFVGPLNMSVVGTVPGNRFQFFFPAVSLTSVAIEARGKLLAYNIGLQYNELSLNDSIFRTYT